MTYVFKLTMRCACSAVTALAALLLLVFAAPVFAQTQAPAPAPATKPAIKSAPAPYTDPASGAAMFKEYCAVCHGALGKGDGPAVAALKKMPTDLTQLAAKNQGKFPASKVTDTLRNGSIAAHGSTDMPIWGPTFNELGGKSVTELRISNLSRYIEGLQVK